MNKKLQILIFFLCFNFLTLFAGVMEKPRKVSVISTNYFDILFSDESLYTAKLLADSADEMYLKAKNAFQNPHDLRILVVISPDSASLSIEYTPSPYNRIVVYEGVCDFEDESYVNGFKELFYRQVAKAVSQSVRSDFWETVSQIIGGDSLQPVALMNMPFSFLEGAVNTDIAKNGSGLLHDSWKLQILSQMKVENKIPTLLQMEGAMDIYPGEKFNTIAGSAFCAYIQQRWGIELFVRFWAEGGKSKVFTLNEGIFEQIYKYPLIKAWENFLDAIPLPDEIACNEQSSLFFNIDNDSVYKHLLYCQYGFIWYDDLKKEVDIYDTFSVIKKRQLLFLASNVYNLSVSNDGRYLAVSYAQTGSRENFDYDVTKIFDLKERRFLPQKYNLRNSTVFTIENADSQSSFKIAGINTDKKHSELTVYKDGEKCFLRGFDFNVGIYSPVFVDENKLAALVCRKNQWYLGIFDLQTKEELYCQLKYNDEFLNIRNLRMINDDYFSEPVEKSEKILLFDFVLQNKNCFTRTGAVTLENLPENCIPKQAFAGSQDFSGGINDCVIVKDVVYYSSHKFNYDEFKLMNLSELDYEEIQIVYPNIFFPDANIQEPVFTQEFSKYKPWKYMFNGNWIPFFPIKDITLQDDVELWPGLGLTFETQSDPLSNNQIMFSAGAMYLPMEFTKLFNPTLRAKQELKAEKLEFNKDFAFSAYAVNTSSPADISAGTIFKFNRNGEYSFKTIGGIGFEFPFSMSFRRMNIDLKGQFASSTSYWDSHQVENHPDLDNWPSFRDSYRSWQTVFTLEYTNIHQYGISPFKKMGIQAGTLVTATWDLNLKGIQQKEQINKNPYSPTQLNTGFYSTIEIPHLTSFQNYNGWILSFPSTIKTELFYTNGTAVTADFKILLLGKELQNGFNKIKLYFPRFGLYGGYNLALDYDTNTVVLPDLRDFTRFYDVFSSCYLNDSIYFDLLLYTTPIVGKFSASNLISLFTVEYYLRNGQCKLHFNFKFEF